jgi:hypothetical protein
MDKYGPLIYVMGFPGSKDKNNKSSYIESALVHTFIVVLHTIKVSILLLFK